MLKNTGVPTLEDIEKITPAAQRRKKGAVAVIECFQNIPCNPCNTSCTTGAIQAFNNINDLPIINEDKCTGCALCVGACPGLAIFVIDETYSENEALIKIPYEYLPIPVTNSIVDVTNRLGEVVGKGRIVQVTNSKKNDKTLILGISVPKELSMVVRGIKLIKESSKDDVCICRCEEITLGEIRQVLEDGYTDFNEIKRKLRVGMGPCQGRTCRPLILKEISRVTGKSMEEIELTSFRPPTKPIKISTIAGDKNEE